MFLCRHGLTVRCTGSESIQTYMHILYIYIHIHMHACTHTTSLLSRIHMHTHIRTTPYSHTHTRWHTHANTLTHRHFSCHTLAASRCCSRRRDSTVSGSSIDTWLTWPWIEEASWNHLVMSGSCSHEMISPPPSGVTPKEARLSVTRVFSRDEVTSDLRAARAAVEKASH